MILRIAAETALRNGSLQGGYFMIAARALGLDCGPMSGFDHDGVDQEFFAGTARSSPISSAISAMAMARASTLAARACRSTRHAGFLTGSSLPRSRLENTGRRYRARRLFRRAAGRRDNSAPISSSRWSAAMPNAWRPWCERPCEAAQLGFAALDRLAVTTGPGTFTGQRVGLAFMRGLRLALKSPLIGVTTLEAMAAPRWRRPVCCSRRYSRRQARRSLYVAAMKTGTHSCRSDCCRFEEALQQIRDSRVRRRPHLPWPVRQPTQRLRCFGNMASARSKPASPARCHVGGAPGADRTGTIDCSHRALYLRRAGRASLPAGEPYDIADPPGPVRRPACYRSDCTPSVLPKPGRSAFSRRLLAQPGAFAQLRSINCTMDLFWPGWLAGEAEILTLGVRR